MSKASSWGRPCRARHAAELVEVYSAPNANADELDENANQQYRYMLFQLMRKRSDSTAVGAVLDLTSKAARSAPYVAGKV
jgi:hypothetical protein